MSSPKDISRVAVTDRDRTRWHGETLIAVGRHLVANPDLPRPTKYGPSSGNPDVATVADLLAWAKSMKVQRVSVCPTVPVVGVFGGQFSVFAEDTGDIQRWVNRLSREWTVITLAQLAAYVAAGTVEHAGELVAS